jgi:gamma-butyrobetaine dioxygenase
LTAQPSSSPERPPRSEGSGLPRVEAADALLGLPAIWLRDNCRCAECRDPRSGERLTSVSDLSASVCVLAVRRIGDQIEVEFGPDRHRSVYDTRWLDQFRPAAGGRSKRPGPPGDGTRREDTAGPAAGAADGRNEDATQLWDASRIAAAFPRGSWPLYQANAAHRQACLRAVLRDGFVVLTDMPREPGAVLTVAHAAGAGRDPAGGRLIDVKVSGSSSAQAFTNGPMAPSTVVPFLGPPRRVTVLGCLNDAAEGGESALVDGFFAAARLRAEHPAAFTVLARTAVTFAPANARAELQVTRPVISLDARDRISEICFSSSYLSPVRGLPHEIVAFYDAYRSFAQLLGSPGLTLTFRLRPGDCLIFDNSRILNGRTGFTDTGQRHLQACWTDLDGLAAGLAVLEHREHNGAARH